MSHEAEHDPPAFETLHEVAPAPPAVQSLAPSPGHSKIGSPQSGSQFAYGETVPLLSPPGRIS